ncbi:MFS transporter [Paenibacillus typhae]|uniref:MFS transporter n=1 Tax=Paenibacillus typhae TaxID=1174501 RepID=UPI001C8DEADF|nr:MFS transporter [Paenibacillus typhae]MBY0009765.1 MFS transporter [Paenibacillus typhae]
MDKQYTTKYAEHGRNKLNEYRKISIFYIVIMGLYQLTDKMYGSGFVALMNSGGLTATQIGLIISLQGLALVIFEYPSGNIADIKGRKKVGSLGLLLWGVSLITFAVSTSFLTFVLSTTLMALAMALISGSHFSWYIDELIRLQKYEDRNRILPWNRGLIMSFSIIGALMASYLMGFNIKLPMMIAGIISIICAIVSFVMFHDNYGSQDKIKFFERINLNTVNFVKDRAMLIVVIKNILYSLGFYIFIVYWQLYAVNDLHLKYSLLGIIMLVMTIILTLSNFIVSYLSRFIGLYSLTVIGGILVIAGFVILSFQGNFLLFITGIIVLELGIGMDAASMGSWLQDHIHSDNRSSYNAAISSLSSLSSIVMPLAAGFIADHSSSTFIWLAAGLCSTVSLIFLMLSLPFLRAHQPKEYPSGHGVS